MWKKGTSPLFPALFSPRDMVGKGEGFPHHRRSGEVSTYYSGGIHRKMWETSRSVFEVKASPVQGEVARRKP